MTVVTNLLTQVANLAGTATDSDAVETWLLDGARQISKYGKVAGKIGEFTEITTAFLDAGTTTKTIDDKGEIIKVTRGGGSQAVKVCRYVDQNEFVKAADTTSIFYENSNDNPIYSVKSNGTNSFLVVSPTPVATTGLVDLEFIPEYSIDTNDNIDQFPRKYYHLCIYYAAIKELGRKLKDAAITVPSLPVSPASPSFTYSKGDLSISNVLPVAPILSENLASISGTAPTYTSPVFNIDNAPTIDNLVISVAPPVVPALSDTTVDTSGLTNPTFTPPVMSTLDFSDTNNWISTEEDPEMLAARVNEIQAKIGDYNARMNEAQAQFSKESAILNKDVQIAIENARMANSADAEKLQKYSNELSSYQAQLGKEVQEWQLNYEADMAVWNQENSMNLQKFQADMQNATNVFNKEVTIYQSQLQVDLQNPQLKESKEGRDLQKYSQELQSYSADINTQVQEYSTNLQNAINTFQKDVQEYQSELAKYQADLGKYQAELGANAQTYQAEIAGLQIKLQQCQAMYQEAIQLEFQISLQADVLDKQGA